MYSGARRGTLCPFLPGMGKSNNDTAKTASISVGRLAKEAVDGKEREKEHKIEIAKESNNTKQHWTQRDNQPTKKSFHFSHNIFIAKKAKSKKLLKTRHGHGMVNFGPSKAMELVWFLKLWSWLTSINDLDVRPSVPRLWIKNLWVKVGSVIWPPTINQSCNKNQILKVWNGSQSINHATRTKSWKFEMDPLCDTIHLDEAWFFLCP